MQNIIFKRNDSFFDRLRSYKIYIDDQFIGNLKNNNELLFRTDRKKIHVKAKIDWMSSSVLHIQNETTEGVICILVKNNFLNSFLILAFFVLVILSKLIPNYNFELTLISIFVVLYHFVKLLILKQKYLILEKLN